jgi:hypothetical protein
MLETFIQVIYFLFMKSFFRLYKLKNNYGELKLIENYKII